MTSPTAGPERDGPSVEKDAPAFRGEWDGLRHECRDPNCHVTAFVETLRLMRDGLDPDIAETIRVLPPAPPTDPESAQ